MARRRSQNRRLSRKSMNITELDQDSELIDTHDPMWWKNIEGEITVRQSRRTSYADTTDPMLNNDSLVDTSELPDEWWNKLDKTDGDSSRRISTRGSIKQRDTPRESLNSDETEDVSIKKRKIQLRARAKKSIGTEVFLAALEDSSGAEKSESGRKRKSKSEAEGSHKRVRKRNRQSGINSSREDPDGSSFDTSTETDIIVKSRPKPFKKRFAKLPDGLFDDILKTENPGTSGITKDKKVYPVRNSSLAKDPTNEGALGAKESSVQLDETARTPVKFSDPEDPGLMGPPKSASHQKRLSSISRNLNLTSDESGNEGGVRKPRLGFAKKARATASINPFDELIGAHLSEANKEIEERGNVNSSIERLERRSGNATRRNTRSSECADEKVNSETRREGSGVRASRGESLAVENLPSIKETSDREDENDAKRSFVSRLTPKILEVSVTRMSPGKRTHVNKESDLEENSQDDRDEEKNARAQSLRSFRQSRSIDDAAYELPAKDRSDTPLFSGSENEDEKSIVQDRSVGASSRAYSPSKREVTINPRESLDSAIANLAEPSTSRKSQGRTNYSRTRIFSDEDISLEDLEEVNRRNEALMKSFSDEERAGLSGKSVKPANKSRRNIQSDESTAEDIDKEAEEADANSKNSHWKEKTRRSRKIVANKSQRSEDETEDAEERGQRSTSFQMGTRTRGSRSSVVANKSRQSILSDDSISEDEPQDAEKTDREAKIFRSTGKSDTSRKGSATNKSRRMIEFDDSMSEDTEADAEKMNEKSQNSRSKGTSRISANASRQNNQSIESASEDKTNDAEKTDLRTMNSRFKSRQSIMTDESTSENESQGAEKTDLAAGNSRFNGKSDASRKSLAKNKSQRIPQFDGNISEYAEENAEKTDEKSINSRLKRKSRTSRESVAPNKSQQPVLFDETDNEDETEDAEGTGPDSQNSPSEKELRGSRKSLAPANKSRLKIHSDESMSEDEAGDAEKTRPSLTKSRRSGKSIIPETTRQSIQLTEKIDEAKNAGKSIETSRRRNLRISDKIDESRGLSVEQHLETAQIVNANDEEDGIDPSIGRKIINSTRRKESSIISTRSNANDAATLIPGKPNAPSLAANLSNDKHSTSHIVDGNNDARKQKSITDFFPSKFLQRSSNTSVREATSSLDRDKLELVKAKMEEMKKQELEAMKLDVEMKMKKKTNPSKTPFNPLRTKRDAQAKENATSKKFKVVDKAYIVNGTVYKRPKLPRPKAWVTDRLYRHLWKCMEPKYNLATRVKSEQFIQQLSEIVALTIRRKKYESYKIEVDALMKEMARLGIVKTRNDFYDFCYDFLPYDFRVKVTPILLPGNVRSIPYDPEKLHTPILRQT